MKTPKIFVPEKNLDSKTEQLLYSPRLNQPDSRYMTLIDRIPRKNDECYELMLTDAEIFDVLEKLPANDVEGLDRIVITAPSRNRHYTLYGRYEKSIETQKCKHGRIYLFKHFRNGAKFEVYLGSTPDGLVSKTIILSPEEFKIKNYEALLHEIGHHVGIKDLGDESEEFAKKYSRKTAKDLGLKQLFL